MKIKLYVVQTLFKEYKNTRIQPEFIQYVPLYTFKILI